MQNAFICQYCGKDTSEVEYDYLSGTDHLSCALTHEYQQNLKNNPIEKCVSCGNETPYHFNDHIDTRYHYVEGSGQLCEPCYNKIYNKKVFTEVEPLGTPNPAHMLIVVDETTILYTPNDQELGAKVRKIYWDLKKEQDGK